MDNDANKFKPLWCLLTLASGIVCGYGLRKSVVAYYGIDGPHRGDFMGICLVAILVGVLIMGGTMKYKLLAWFPFGLFPFALGAVALFV